MFIDIGFLGSDENLNIIKKALDCRKITSLIIDGHYEGFAESCAKEKPHNLNEMQLSWTDLIDFT